MKWGTIGDALTIGKMPAYMELKKQEEASQVEKPLNEWTDEELSAGKLLGGG